jgi:hypothetical protein
MLTRTSIAAIVFMVFVVCLSSAAAEERFGVAVYPGAKYDPAGTKRIQDSPSAQGAAYRTSDDIEKVVAFYRKQGLLLLKAGSPSKDHARFKKADTGVDVVVGRVRKDSQTGEAMTGTLIQIIKEKEKKGSRSDTSI